MNVIKKGFKLMPPHPDLCQECAIDHDPRLPHDQQSLYYQVNFHQREKRWPTWADAMAHCDDVMKELWKEELAGRGVKW